MFLPFNLGVDLPPNILLPEQVIEEKIEEPILTWRDNPNGCDESRQYIAAESPYYCIDRPISSFGARTGTLSSSDQSTVKTAQNASSGWYSWGWCTYFISTQRPVGQWNNARDWFWQAQRDGWATGYTPAVGAIAQKDNHVAIVRAVSGDQMTIQEMNYEGFGVISSRTISSSGWRFIY